MDSQIPGLDGIVEQGTALKVLRSALPPGRPAGAYLFVGPEGVGKRTAAMAFARAIFCDTGGADSCGRCGPCVKIEHGNFPDLIQVKPEVREKKVKEEIDIASVRKLIERIGFRPYEARRKVAIVDGADRMNTSAANAFLKTLEEPPDDTILIMIASNMSALLPTIISRCQVVRFRPISHDGMVSLIKKMKGVSGDEAETAAALSKGSPGAALSDSLEEDQKTRELAVNLLANARTMSVAQIYSFANRLDRAKDREGTDRLLSAVRELVRDTLVMQITGKYGNLINVDIADSLNESLRGISPRRLFSIYDGLNRLAAARRWNVSPLLTLTLMLLELKR